MKRFQWFGWFFLIFFCFMAEMTTTLSASLLQNSRRLSRGNVVIFSATGRVGSTNLLTMLNGKLKNIGEIFISFQSRNLPPDPISPVRNPSNDVDCQRIIRHIQHSFPKREQSIPLVASIKFWHAWSNGVTVHWLAKSLMLHGSVTHFILIARNPTRITVSEQYGHRYHAWSYNNKGSIGSSNICDRSYLAHHIGGRWMSQMAVKHYQSFIELISLSGPIDFSFPSESHSSNVSLLGLSYEADILIDPLHAYLQIMSFLSFANSTSPPSTHRKGLDCLLSSMLINYEELVCTFYRYDRLHLFSPLSWMATDNDQANKGVTFSQIMTSWKVLSESSEYNKKGYLSECDTHDILQALPHLQEQYPLLQSLPINFSPSTSKQTGLCGVGGHQSPYCPDEGIQAIPSNRVHDFCPFTLFRSKCDIMTIRDGKCYLHSNQTSMSAPSVVRLERCDKQSYLIAK